MEGLAVNGESRLKPDLEFSGDMEDKIIQACDECLAAHRQCTELNPEMGGALAGRGSSSSGDYPLYSKRRSEALAKLMKLRASSARGLAAKRDVLRTLLDWFDFDDPFIGKFASRLVDEYHWVCIGGSSGALWPDDRPSTKAFWSALVKLCLPRPLASRDRCARHSHRSRSACRQPGGGFHALDFISSCPADHVSPSS